MTVWLVRYGHQSRLYPDLKKAFLAMTVLRVIAPERRITIKRMRVLEGLVP